MREVDRAMVEDHRIELLQMMEDAGRNLADLARGRFLHGNPDGRAVVALAGSGGNGGGALVCARRLANWRVDIRVYLTRPANSMARVLAHQLDIPRHLGVPAVPAEMAGDARGGDLVIDRIVGYSLSGAPRGAAADLILWANAQRMPVLALDVPSELDGTTGDAYDPCIQATATMTPALANLGLRDPRARPYVGELYLADISVPPRLYALLGLHVGALFAEQDIVRVW
ncbi:MAG TPA: NAD(P)H-hydrate epimerase, partial [Anaerolineae bacterium]|nr:NAD(P)H-hydrate epimerase [Anaerolineae bacterium]